MSQNNLTGLQGRILVVDDEPSLRLGFRVALMTQGYQVDEACCGEEAIQVLKERPHSYEAMVLDLRMPGLDGIEVLEELTRTSIHQPTVILSAYLDSRTALHAATLGVVNFLRKPVSPGDLRDVVAQIISEEREILQRGTGVATMSMVRSLIRRRRFQEASEVLDAIESQPSDSADPASPWRLILGHILKAEETQVDTATRQRELLLEHLVSNS